MSQDEAQRRHGIVTIAEIPAGLRMTEAIINALGVAFAEKGRPLRLQETVTLLKNLGLYEVEQ